MIMINVQNVKEITIWIRVPILSVIIAISVHLLVLFAMDMRTVPHATQAILDHFAIVNVLAVNIIYVKRILAHARTAALMATTRKQTVHVVSVIPDVLNVLALIHVLNVKIQITGEQYVKTIVTTVKVVANLMDVHRVATMATIRVTTLTKEVMNVSSVAGPVHCAPLTIIASRVGQDIGDQFVRIYVVIVQSAVNLMVAHLVVTMATICDTSNRRQVMNVTGVREVVHLSVTQDIGELHARIRAHRLAAYVHQIQRVRVVLQVIGEAIVKTAALLVRAIRVISLKGV